MKLWNTQMITMLKNEVVAMVLVRSADLELDKELTTLVEKLQRYMNSVKR